MAAARIAGDTVAGGGVSRETFAVPGERAAPRVTVRYDGPDASLSDECHLETYLKHLFLPSYRDDGEIVVLAARDDPQTWRAAWDVCGFNLRIVVCRRQVVIDAIQHRFREKLAQDAQFALDKARPMLSARCVITQGQRLIILSALAAVACTAILAPSMLADIGLAALALLYFLNIGLRYVLFAAGWSGDTARRTTCPSDNDQALPVYSILVPLFREANMIGEITRALQRLDYPADRLDIKLVLEEYDREMVAALRSADLDERFELLIVPDSNLRTKPRACNHALPFCRGEFVVIFDAEDRPQRDQLKKSVAAFRAQPNIACFQARLGYHNARRNWLSSGLMAQTPQARRTPITKGMRENVGISGI